MAINPLISIILPVYNQQNYITETISSVLNQTYTNWELLIVNDGSTDGSEEKIFTFNDRRIQYLKKENGGVSSARNLALTKINGDFFCFLDGDDTFPPNSLNARMNIFKSNPEISFVDGSVQYVDNQLNKLQKIYSPKYNGKPLKKLLQLSSDCFFGNTWMIKRQTESTFFRENLSHSEDLFFYIDLCRKTDGKYSFTSENILNYRQSTSSAMSNLEGLEKSYISFIKESNNLHNQLLLKFKVKFKIAKIMFLSFLSNRKVVKAIQSVFKIIVA